MVSNDEPILASWKISEVLARYPALLDTLVGLSPAFTKLRNPMLRKVQSRLVTVSQAARIAGLDPAMLTQQLNQAAGNTAPDHVSSEPGADHRTVPAWAEDAHIAHELDVRPILERGEEPFRAIMEAARRIPEGKALRLHVGFEPVPLYDALGKQGFVHRTSQPDGDTWQVDFIRLGPAAAPVAARTVSESDWHDATAEVTIDVSELVPPEPMMKVLQALESLPGDAMLLVHHVRRPIYLYERLDEMGYPHRTRDLAPDRVDILIRKPAVNGEPA